MTEWLLSVAVLISGFSMFSSNYDNHVASFGGGSLFGGSG